MSAPTAAMRAALVLTGGDKLYVANNGWCDPEEVADIIERETRAGAMTTLLQTFVDTLDAYEQQHDVVFPIVKEARALLAPQPTEERKA